MNAANSSCEGGMCESLAANDAPMAAAYDQTLHAASAPGAAVSPKKRTREEAEATDKNNAGASPAATRGGEDTASVATMPMPNRPLNTDDSEVTSAAVAGPNDLAGSTQSPAAAKRRKTGAAAQDSDAAAAAAAAAEAESVFKAVLVAKVLTKSDASSKRIILPRISVEANLPELTAPNGGGAGGAHGQGRHLHFDALDRHGRRWELTVKAWANGSNPKPVFVLEGGIAELMKKYKLGPGDVVGLLASADGRHFVHWNTEQVGVVWGGGQAGGGVSGLGGLGWGRQGEAAAGLGGLVACKYLSTCFLLGNGTTIVTAGLQTAKSRTTWWFWGGPYCHCWTFKCI